MGKFKKKEQKSFEFDVDEAWLLISIVVDLVCIYKINRRPDLRV